MLYFFPQSFRMIPFIENLCLLLPAPCTIYGSNQGLFYIKVTFFFQPVKCLTQRPASGDGVSVLAVTGTKTWRSSFPWSLRFQFVFCLLTKYVTLQGSQMECTGEWGGRGAELSPHFADTLGCLAPWCLSLLALPVHRVWWYL